MGELRIEPTEATLGARVTGVALGALDAATWREIEAAFLEYAVLVFPAQGLRSSEQVAFARRFGEIEHLFGDSGIVPITNQRRDGSLMDDAEAPMQIMRGNEGWHTDSSYMPVAAKASVLSAHVVPSAGGQTEWADMRAAWDELDATTRADVRARSALHSIRHSQRRIGHADGGDSLYGYFDGDPPRRPLMKVHPVTQRPALFIGRHAYGVPGLDAAESERWLDALLERACQPPRLLRHDWQVGDLAIWDNRCVLHRARPYDHSEPRLMKHTRIAGDPATEGAAA
ncbi:MAG: TauD/TfdA dioxygenase family protein [Myxococcota bacterium]